ncbi:MAG TPA: S8 family serine peptidase [Blastocatellia bacterium]|nr:S8 family serine peptidase [Blastocatellia bacterium]
MRRFFLTILALIVSNIAIGTRITIPARASGAELAYAPGEVIVKLKHGADDLAQVAAQVDAMAGSTDSNLALVRDGNSEPLARRSGAERLDGIISQHGLDRIFVLKVDSGVDMYQTISRLKANDAVEYAEPNYFIKLGSFIPDDPKFGEQWALRNLGLGVTGYPATLDADIKATEAWTITIGSPDVIVAVTDTGMDITHPDLAPNIYTNPREIAGNGRDDDGNGYVDDVNGYNVADGNNDVSDVVGHGTEMAGIIAARTNNQAGISGMSQSRILPVKFFRRTGPGPSDINATVADAARALLYSIAAGASIINASWTTLLSVPEDQANALRDAVAATNDAGVLLVCIAGNQGVNDDVTKVYPGAYQLDNEIVTAASQYNDEIWHPPFEPTIVLSGYGKNSVDLAAPGMAVFTTSARGQCSACTQSSNPDDWYGNIDGTSAAAAYVSGVAALVRSRYPDDYVTVLKRRILESVDVRESLQRFVKTSGRLNAYGALTIQISITPPSLTRLKYKTNTGKLLLYGEGIQQGAVALVGASKYKAKFKGGDQSRVVSTVPESAFPAGASVQVRLLNPDGGLSQALNFSR